MKNQGRRSVILRENEKSNYNKIFIAGKPADWLHFRLGSEFLTLTVCKVAMFLFSFPLWGRLVTFLWGRLVTLKTHCPTCPTV